MRFLIPVIAALVVLSGCHAKASAPGEAPTGVAATSGDGLVVINWDVLPDLTYWIFFQAGSTVDVASPNSTVIRRAIAPRVISGLANGTQYAFAMNATHNDSAAGPSSTPVVGAPAFAGTNWFAGTPLPLGGPPANLRGLAVFGSRFVTVGDATTTGTLTSPTILAGDFNYTVGLPFNLANGNPQGVNSWMIPASLPVGFAANLTSVTSIGSGFVVLAANGSVISSSDGLNWVSNSTIPATGMNSVTFGLASGVPTYMAVGNGGSIFSATNIDIVSGSWTPGVSGTTNDLTGILPVPGSFFVTGAGGTLLNSVDGSNWNPQTTNTTNTLRGIAFCGICPGVRYVAVGDSGTIITSTDGVTWNVIDPSTFTPPFPAPPPNLLGVTVGGSAGTRFLAVGQGGAVVFSDDGVNWLTASSGSSNLAQVLYFGGLYLSVGDAGANVVSR